MSKCYQLICHDVAFTSAYMIRDSSSSVAINDYPHTRTLTHGHHHHSLGHAQSCVSVGLVWSFGTIIKPRMNVFDCRRQIKGIQRHCNRFANAVIRCGVRHFSSFSHAVLRPLMKHIGIVLVSVNGKKSAYWLSAENDVLGLTLTFIL